MSKKVSISKTKDGYIKNFYPRDDTIKNTIKYTKKFCPTEYQILTLTKLPNVVKFVIMKHLLGNNYWKIINERNMLHERLVKYNLHISKILTCWKEVIKEVIQTGDINNEIFENEINNIRTIADLMDTFQSILDKIDLNKIEIFDLESKRNISGDILKNKCGILIKNVVFALSGYQEDTYSTELYYIIDEILKEWVNYLSL